VRRYVENSPYFRADRIHTPILIIHGRDDSTCPVDDAERMFSALKRLGRTAQLAVYEGQGHVIYEWESKQASARNRSWYPPPHPPCSTELRAAGR
jgi:dipeptidyl aminopeptidase/acylaminoacyl peptidase